MNDRQSFETGRVIEEISPRCNKAMIICVCQYRQDIFREIDIS